MKITIFAAAAFAGAASAAVAATRNVEAGCYPTTTQSSIKHVLKLGDALIHDIHTGNNRSGVADLGEFNGFLGDVFRAVDKNRKTESGCNNPTAAEWPSLPVDKSKARFIDIVNGAKGGLRALSEHVKECREKKAFHTACGVLAIVENLDTYYTSK